MFTSTPWWSTAVFAKDGESVRFHPCPSLHAADVDEVLATVEAYVQLGHGLGVEGASQYSGDHALGVDELD